MTALPELHCRYLCVPRLRGQQLKEQAQLDGWLRDGSPPISRVCAIGKIQPHARADTRTLGRLPSSCIAFSDGAPLQDICSIIPRVHA